MTTYYEPRKSTEAERASDGGGQVLRVPQPLETGPYTYEKLFERMEVVFDLDEDEVKSILKAAGFSNFNPHEWLTYFDVIRLHLDEKKALSQWPKDCPICHADIEYDPNRNGTFGEKLGWKCSSDPTHFTLSKAQYLAKLAEAKKERIKNREIIIEPDCWRYK